MKCSVMLNLEETLIMREESLAGVLESHFFSLNRAKIENMDKALFVLLNVELKAFSGYILN